MSKIYDVSQYNGLIQWGQVQADCVLIRCSTGAYPDSRYAFNWANSARIPRRGAYHYVVTGVAAGVQLDAILSATGKQWGSEPFTVDVEPTQYERERIAAGWVFPRESYTANLKALIDLLSVYVRVRIYTSKNDWALCTTQPAWAVDDLHWIAHYNSHVSEPDRPAGWDWQLWQYGQESVPWCDNRTVDVNREKPMLVPEVSHGPKFGLHSINNQHIQHLVDKWAGHGWTWPVVKKVNDASPLIHVKAVMPQAITVGRYINTSEYESLQNVGSWSPDKMRQFARESIQLILGRTPDDQLRATDYWTVINETNPRDEPNGYTGLGQALIELVLEADRHSLKLSLPSFPQGCPEWNQGDNAAGGGMVELCNTGLFGLMKSGGHVYDCHEGVYENEAVDKGWPGGIPRAPYVFGAGVYNFRHRYLYHLLEQRGEVVPLIISEFYGGGHYPPALSYAETLERFVWYDRIARTEPYLLGFLGFTIDPDATWIHQDYSGFYDSEEVERYWGVEHDLPNVEVPMDTAKILANATTARDASQAIIDEINAGPLFMAQVLQGVRVRDKNGNALVPDLILTVGTQVAIYKENVTAGTYTQRAVVNTNGNNIVMVNNGQPTYKKV